MEVFTMKRNYFTWALAILILVALISQGNTATRDRLLENKQPVIPAKSSIDLAFCIDTTGSMGGLIEGAKQKVWSIVNAVAGAQPKPVLRIALVAYRDHGDTYVTQKYDFTSDLETMYSRLRSFQAVGGGDTPEDVNGALNDAINGLEWSRSASTLKMLYLVGDAPPHMDYQQGYDYKRIAGQAAGRGIIVNTIQCGTVDGTREVWQQIARIAEGKYIAIGQTGDMIAVASPYDDKLAKLSDDLNRTYVAYGAEGGRMLQAQTANDADAATRAPAAAAERAASKAGGLYHNETWDLVDAVNSHNVRLDSIKPTELPSDMKGMNQKERQAYLDAKAKDRQRIQKEIQDLSKQREAYVDSELKKSGAKTDASFDTQVLNTLKEQGEKKGIRFENPTPKK